MLLELVPGGQKFPARAEDGDDEYQANQELGLGLPQMPGCGLMDSTGSPSNAHAQERT